MPAQPLRLDVEQFIDADHWRWVLKEDGGAFLADHTVALDNAHLNYKAILDLPSHLQFYAAPHNRDADERQMVRGIGSWLGEHVLGRRIGEVLLQRATPSVVVRVMVPPEADRLLALPFEVARLDDGTLTENGVSFVFETKGRKPPPARPVEGQLRVLALFSLPPVGSPLNPRRERQMLRTLFLWLARASRLAVHLHVLQYGVTRGSLQDVLQDGEG